MVIRHHQQQPSISPTGKVNILLNGVNYKFYSTSTDRATLHLIFSPKSGFYRTSPCMFKPPKAKERLGVESSGPSNTKSKKALNCKD